MRRCALASLGIAAAVLLSPVPATADSVTASDPATTTATAAPSATAEPAPEVRPGTAAPGPVGALGWAAEGRGARLRWQAPSGAGAGVGYTVTVRPISGAAWTAETTSTTLLVRDVPAGTHLRATVQAHDDAGTGPAVAAPAWAPPRPSAPASAAAAAVPGRGALAVTWSPPAPGGGGVTGYVVEVRAVRAPDVVAARRAAPAASRSITVTGLRRGVRYLATVAAVSAAGTGATRATATVVTTAEAADAPCVACGGDPVAAPSPHGVATARPATAATSVAAAPPVRPSSATTAVPLKLVLAVGGIVVAAGLAITAVLLRRRLRVS